jgi:TRAP-type uncharacterized transport system fused permease subunit
MYEKNAQAEATRWDKMRLLAYVLYVYAAVAVAVAVALIFLLGPAATIENGTSVRILGAALLALSYGAVAAARDPLRHRVVLIVEVLFMGLSALALVYRLGLEHHMHDRTWLVLPPLLVCLVLLLLLFPYGRSSDERGNDRR